MPILPICLWGSWRLIYSGRLLPIWGLGVSGLKIQGKSLINIQEYYALWLQPYCKFFPPSGNVYRLRSRDGWLLNTLHRNKTRINKQ